MKIGFHTDAFNTSYQSIGSGLPPVPEATEKQTLGSRSGLHGRA